MCLELWISNMYFDLKLFPRKFGALGKRYIEILQSMMEFWTLTG